MQNNDFLTEEYTIDTPENVTFGYEVVGIGSRFVAAVVDTIILIFTLTVLLFVVMIALALLSERDFGFDALWIGNNDWLGGIIAAIYTLLNFIIFWGYYIVFELLWNGQSPGKRVAKIRVVRTDGNPIGFLQSAVRNLVRFVDFMPTAYGFGLVTMFFNSKSRRLGDFAAGTIVVRDKTELRLEDVVGGNKISNPARPAPVPQQKPTANPLTGYQSQAPATMADGERLSTSMSAPASAVDPLANRFPNIRNLTTNEYELITDTLARRQTGQLDGAMVSRLAAAIAQKLDAKTPPPTYRANASENFLQDVAEAYRRAQ